jgi:hypothetical protein
MNIKSIIEKHRTAQEVAKLRTEAQREHEHTARSVQKRIVREMLFQHVRPLLDQAVSELEAYGFEAHATQCEEERGGDTLEAWVVATVSLVLDREHPRIVSLQFIGVTTVNNWHILAQSAIVALPEASLRFTGTPEEIEGFVSTNVETFVTEALALKL